MRALSFSTAWRVEESGEVIRVVRVRCHHHSSRPSATAASARPRTARPYAPSLAARTASTAEAGGTQRRMSETGSRADSPAPEPNSFCAPTFTPCAPMATNRPLSTARSRPRRLVSSRTLAVATARASATHTRTTRTTARTPTTAAPAVCASMIAEPAASARVNTGPMPTSDVISSETMSGRGRSGSMTSRVGSRVSSPEGKNSGIAAQPSVSTAASRTPSALAWSTPRRAIRPSSTPAAHSRDTTSDAT